MVTATGCQRFFFFLLGTNALNDQDTSGYLSTTHREPSEAMVVMCVSVDMMYADGPNFLQEAAHCITKAHSLSIAMVGGGGGG